MTSCTYAECRLDDISSRWLTLWNSELQATERSVQTALTAIESDFTAMQSSSKRAATATFYGSANNRCIFTWKVPGLEGNSWSISLLANLAYAGDKILQRLVAPNSADTLTVSSHVIHAVNANLTDSDLNRVVTISASTSTVSNNGTYTIIQVNSATDLVTLEAFPGDDEVYLTGIGESLTLVDAPNGLMLLADTFNFPEGLSSINEVTISGAAHAENNGTFQISTVIAGMGLFYVNSNGITENPFAGSWEIDCSFFDGTSDGIYDRCSALDVDIDEAARVISIKLSVLLSGPDAGTVLTGPKALADWVNAHPVLSTYVTASAPDYDPGVGTDPELVYASTRLSGGHNASLTAMGSTLNKTFAATQGYSNALRIAGLPGGSTNGITEASGIIILSSGKAFSTKNSTNLVEIWRLFEVLGGVGFESSLASLLSFGFGPLVLWVRTDTTIIELPSCSGGGTQTMNTNVLECYNTKPAKNSTAFPWIWWLTRLQGNSTNLYKLKKCGLNRNQIENALDSSYEHTWIIEDPSILENLTSSDVRELYAANVAGIEPLSYLDALNGLSQTKASAATGFSSPILNLPASTLKAGINETNATTGLSRTATMANEVLASSCIDPAAKSGLISVLSAVDSGISAFSHLVRALVRVIRVPVNKATKMAETLLAFFSGVNDNTTCIDLSFDLATDTDIELIKLELPAFTTELNNVIDKIVAALDEIRPSACKLKKALHELIFTGSEELDCLMKGLTNDLVNFAGAQVKKLLPCIVNPLDYLSMITQLSAKLDAEIAVINGLIRDLLVLSSVLNSLINWEDDTSTKEATVTCSSSALGGMVKHVKSTFGV